jgi:hypothetical protein
MLKSLKKKVETAANEGKTGNRHDRDSVAQTAYFLAEKRGFAPGADLDDWYAAEEIVAKEA